MVVVVSPTTEPAPPAFEAAQIAAAKPMWIFPPKTAAAIEHPIRAAAILSRKVLKVNTKHSNTAPVH